MYTSFSRLGVIILLFIWGCQTQETNMENMLQATPFFDLKGVINEQITMLDQLKPSVKVTAHVREDKETQTLQKDSSEWAEALKLYADADLNKPVLRDQYNVRDSVLEGQNLRAKIYEAKNKNEVEVPYMKVIYEDTITNLREVESRFHEKNPLYSTSRSMSLYFDEIEGSPRLIRYVTRGKQKMLFKDSVVYATTAEIQY